MAISVGMAKLSLLPYAGLILAEIVGYTRNESL